MEKRIALLVSCFPLISEAFILNQVTALIRGGWQVRIISLLNPDLSQVQPDFTRFNCRENLVVAGVPQKALPRLLKAGLIGIKLLFRLPRIAAIALNRARYSTATASLKTLYAANALGESQTPVQLLHAHFGPNGLLASFLKDAGFVKRFAVSFHGADISSYARHHGGDIYAYMFSRADVVTANTRFTAAKVEAHGGKEVVIIPVGLNCRDYPRRPEPDASAGFTIVTVGRCVEVKGHCYALGALLRIVQRGRVAIKTWHMVGDGPLRREIEREAGELGLSNILRFYGSVDADSVRELLSSAHLFVLPSVTSSSGDMEAQGLVFQEAQSMGLPVIGTLDNGIPEGVLDGESGLLVPEKYSDALAVATERILGDGQWRKQASAAGAAFVRSRYDSDALISRWESVYAGLMEPSYEKKL